MDFFEEEAIFFNESKNNEIAHRVNNAISQLKQIANKNKVHIKMQRSEKDIINSASNEKQITKYVAFIDYINYFNQSKFDSFSKELLNKFSKNELDKNYFYFDIKEVKSPGRNSYYVYLTVVTTPSISDDIKQHKNQIIDAIKTCQNEIAKTIRKHNMGKYLSVLSAEEIYKDIANDLARNKNTINPLLVTLEGFPEDELGANNNIDEIEKELDKNKTISKYGEINSQSAGESYYIFKVEFHKKNLYKESVDFFEEEAVRINEGLIKYIKDKKQAKEAIKNNKQIIIKSISKALKDLEKYFSKLSIEVRPAETVYNGMVKNAKLDTQCGSISFTKSGVSKAEIFRQTSAFKQYCKQNKCNYKFKFIDSNTLSMYNTGDGDMIIFLILDDALIK